MSAITLAVVTAAIGIVGKIFLDLRSEHQAKRALAAALRGELRAYLRLSKPEQTLLNIGSLVKIPYERRLTLLPGLFTLPTGHPVFDRVADKIGLLSPKAAHGISEAYNIFTGARMMITSFSSSEFLRTDDEDQVLRINAIVETLSQELPGIRETAAHLDRLSEQSFLSYIFGRTPD